MHHPSHSPHSARRDTEQVVDTQQNVILNKSQKVILNKSLNYLLYKWDFFVCTQPTVIFNKSLNYLMI